MNIKNYDFYYELRSLPFVKAIYLYGSRAKGTSQERSDIDLAITCTPDATNENWRKICEVIDHADTLLSIDYVRLETLKDVRLKEEIENSKCVLFERKPNNYPWYEIYLDLGEALDKLEDIMQIENSSFPYIREAAIQVFEYNFELFWKLLKKICLKEGFETNSPRSTLQRAYSMRLIDNENLWLDMMEDRNLTSHTYKQPTAKEIFEHIKNYCILMKQTYGNLKVKYSL